MKASHIFLAFITAVIIVIILYKGTERSDPYEEGRHWDYSIRCEEGFLWKRRSSPQSTIPLLHSDGTQVRCGEKRR